GLISAAAQAGSTPAARQFQAEPRGDARIFCAIGGRTPSRPRTTLPRLPAINVLVRGCRVFCRHAQLIARRPSGHPPSALGPPIGGPFFDSGPSSGPVAGGRKLT